MLSSCSSSLVFLRPLQVFSWFRRVSLLFIGLAQFLHRYLPLSQGVLRCKCCTCVPPWYWVFILSKWYSYVLANTLEAGTHTLITSIVSQDCDCRSHLLLHCGGYCHFCFSQTYACSNLLLQCCSVCIHKSRPCVRWDSASHVAVVPKLGPQSGSKLVRCIPVELQQ